MNTFKRLLIIGALFYGLAVSIASAAAPVLTETTAVPLLSNDNTPQVTVNSTEIADLAYGGSCGVGDQVQIPIGDSDITYFVLADGTYADCTITGTNPATLEVSTALTLTLFTIDATAPVITETSGIITPTSDNTPDYIFNTDEAGSITYGGDCSSITSNAVIGGNTITLNALGDGAHSNCTITVTDSVGNTSLLLAITAFTIDTAMPIVTETSAIITPTNDNTPDYGFNTDKAGSIAYGGDCSSATPNAVIGDNTITLNALSDGVHSNCTISVTDSLGNTSSLLAITAFTVDTVMPIVTETSAIITPTNDNTPDYVFNTNEAGSITYGGDCSSATSNAVIGSNTITLNALSDGVHSNCTITVTDSAGNTSLLLSMTAFTVDTTAPIVTETSAIITPDNDNTPDYVFNTDEAGSITYGGDCSSATLNAVIGNNTITLNTLGDGTHSNCTITVTDSVGNTSLLLNITSFTVDTTAPVFSSLGVTSDNLVDASYGKPGSILTFELQLSAADSYAGGGSINFNIGTTSKTILFQEIASTTALNTYIATYTITNENGAIVINNITFTDFCGQAITGFVAGAPTPTVTIDSIAPIMNAIAVSTTGNAGWARAGQVVTYSLGFSEDILGNPVMATTAFNTAGAAQKDFNYPAPTFVTSGTIEFGVVAGNNGLITINNGNITIQDRAGNTTVITAAMINVSAIGLEITADTTIPTIAGVSIISNNANTTLAKTNDTITVSLTTADNLSPSVTLLGTAHILNSAITDGVTGLVGVGFISRFTDGTETSQVVVPFGMEIMDEAGNTSAWVTATNDGSIVQFDRTNPVIRNVRLSALSQDGSAYLGDVPDYYAKQGDDITLRFEARDWVDLLNGGITGTLFTVPVSLAKTNPACDGTVTWCEWITTITNVDGIEGTVLFDILAIDNAGNGNGDDVVINPEIHVTGTTDGSSVIFDKTIPVNPTDVVDVDGTSTTSFKPGTSAIYTWTNDSDPLPLSGTNAGVWKYYVAFTNPDNGGEFHSGSNATLSHDTVSLYDGAGNLTGSRYLNATISDLAPWTGQLIPPRNLTPVYYPYQLRMITVDKAGNMPYNTFGDETQLAATQPQVVYEQPYTITIYGTVVDRLGAPVPNALVQAVARYGEFCNEGKEVCSDTTDAQGRYSILVNKDQDYNITFFARGAYTNKKDRSILADYFLLDVSLSDQESIHEVQQFESIIRLILTKTFQKGDIREYVQFDIYTNSGQITTRQEGEDVVINSLSTITKVQQYAPFLSEFVTIADTPKILTSSFGDITISSIGNEWRITGGGSVKEHNGTEIDYDTDQNTNGYGEHLAMILDPGNGTRGFSGDKRGEALWNRGHIWTKEELKKDMARIDAGNDPAVLFYTNFNGYAVFAGYRSGTLPMSKRGARYRNRVRPGINATQGEEDFSEKLEKVKEIAGSEKEEKVTSKKSKFAPLVRLRAGDEARAAIARRKYVSTKINKFARYNPNSNPPKTNTRSKTYRHINMKIGGHSVSMNKVVGLENGGR